ncbi:glycosyltransferase family 39 protein [Pseudonocardia alni]|uniref:4-amino-4-deoxy-L-arabinose transferase-like glycosyltransferase n=1 Tax=Pseudonocardia alni TaxID=33907 RepID=A0AA44UN73_PSEA5|nr:4-amino-4-deoxy-L-arabinose transferase-like glycosyltransferase [Pseudonocardia alni]
MSTATPVRPGRDRAGAPPVPAPPAAPPAVPPGRVARLLRGPAGDPGWARPGLLVLLAGTALLYLWDLSASGYANDFYAAAVQAGTQSWKAWLFGSLDSGNAITVDKPPAALWVMTASARLFGFSSWSLLVPQALMGVGAVALLHATVRRWAGPAAGLLAGAVLALPPAAVLMFRFDNPDALLTLLLVVAAWAGSRAVDAASVRASTWWLVAAGSAVGSAFLTKMGQALLVVPALGLVYLVAGSPRMRIRIVQMGAAVAAMVVSAGWFIALVELWPASDRPYIGGSTTNSLLELALGYNGLGRLLGGTGNGGGPGGGSGGGNTGFGGSAGPLRLFTGELAYEISWLLPAALILLVAGLWVTRRAPRTDRTRAALLLWGGWTLVTAAVFSMMSGTMHPYYTVALAPGLAGVVAVGGAALWRDRGARWARIVAATTVLVTGGWAVALLVVSAESFSWLSRPVGAVTVVAAGLMLGPGRGRAVVRSGLVAVLVAGMLGTGVYAVATASTGHTGSIPSVGTVSSSFGTGTGTGTGTGASGGPGSGPAGPGEADGTGGFGGAGATAPGQGGGVPGSGSATSAELTSLLAATRSLSGTTWSAAVATSQTAASLELASGTAVMSTGGWAGSDSAVTLAEFRSDVEQRRIAYYVAGGQGGGPGGPGGQSDSTSSRIATWVAEHYTATTVGGQTVYDLSAPTS